MDAEELLADIDFSAVVLLDDKLKECDYFYSLLQNESDRNKFRWLLGAFLNACYGYLEDKAAYLHFGFCDRESGEPIEDQKALAVFNKYVGTTKKSKFIKTYAISDLMKKLYKYRGISTHDGGVGVIQAGDNLPSDFQVGYLKSECIPALAFCRGVLSFFSELEAELNM